METEAQWRDRYLQLAEQAEAEEKKYQKAESELMRLLSRLCVATSGLDVMLDPHLERVRKTVREGSSTKLVSQAQRLGDALLKAQDERTKGDLLDRVLDRSRLPGKQVKAASGYGESWRPPPTRPVMASWTSWLDCCSGGPKPGQRMAGKAASWGVC